ncbi:hypothetical protein TUBRATIS_008750 [Tubulinosema ratisbonensis]|uniref:Uncharacterized protein n=1 Tax=Tubulinosema ratisbonensis TaxID=291195 RepID=A0A437AN67_9MICR|nr:hypothetical protein TUBRATIS_008750 [Tubulinosema ratisbonensis]
MNNTTKYFIFLFTRNYIPITSYLTPYTLENKEISKKNLLNRITHKLFIATIITSVITPFFIEAFGKKLICVCDNLIECVVYLIFLFMPKRNLILCELAGILHGITKSLESISKSIMYDGDPKKSAQKYAIYSIVKQVSSTLAAISGQEMFYMTNSYSILVYTSLLSVFFSFFFALFCLEELEKKTFDLQSLYSPKKLFLELKNELSFDVCVFSLFYVISTTLLISLSVYSSYIFMERKNELDIYSSKLGKFFYLIFTPFRIFFFFIVKFFSFFDKSIKVNLKYNKNVILFGYINAFCRLVSLLPKYTIMKYEFNSFSRSILLTLFILSTILILFFLFKINNLFITYVLTVIGLFFSFTCLGVSNNGFKNHSKSHVIYSMNLFFSALIHSGISYYAKSKEIKASVRLLYYCFVDGILTFLIFFVVIYKKYLNK